jgi:hypothetical protein
VVFRFSFCQSSQLKLASPTPVRQEVGVIMEEEWIDTDGEEEREEEKRYEGYEGYEGDEGDCEAEIYCIKEHSGMSIDPFSSDRLMSRRNAVCCKTAADWKEFVFKDFPGDELKH